MMTDIKENIDEMLDIKDMVIKRLTKDKGLLNDMFIQVGNEEFKLIERSGFTWDSYLVVVQMLVWFFYPKFWILPLFGLCCMQPIGLHQNLYSTP